MTIGGGSEKGVEGPVKSDARVQSSLGLGAASPSFNKIWEVANTKPNTATTLPGFELTGAIGDSENQITGESFTKKGGHDVASNKPDSLRGKGTSIYKEPVKPKEGKKEDEKSKAKEPDEHAKKDDSRDNADGNTPPQDDAARGAGARDAGGREAAGPPGNPNRIPQGGPRAPEILPAGSKPINNGAK